MYITLESSVCVHFYFADLMCVKEEDEIIVAPVGRSILLQGFV